MLFNVPDLNALRLRVDITMIAHNSSARMNLFQNSIINLDYNPATDILEAAYPNLHDFLLPEIKHSILILIDVVKNYDIKRMLLDSSKTMISVNDEQSREITVTLASGLANTRLQKLARVQSISAVVETTAQQNIKHLNSSMILPYQLHTFTEKALAIEWLKG